MTDNIEQADNIEREAVLDTIRQVIRSGRGMAKTSRLKDAGVSYKRILSLVESGDLIRVKSGYYTISGGEYTEEEKILSQFPDGVLTMESALFFHGYIQDRPATWMIAINKNTSKSRFKLQDPPVHPYYTEESVLKDGVMEIPFADDGRMQIYTRDRLICDVIKYRDRLPRNIFQQAIRAYLDDDDKNAAKLMEHAALRRVTHLVRNILGTWISLPGTDANGIASRPQSVQVKPPAAKPRELHADAQPLIEQNDPPAEEIIPNSSDKSEEVTFEYTGADEIPAASDSAEVSGCIFVILRQMELIEDMGILLRLYNIISTRSADGMEISRRLLELCEEEDFVPQTARIRKIQGWAIDRFMEQKWEKYIKRNGMEPVSWMEFMAKLASFIVPIGKSIAAGQPFMGDWMPQIGRFL